MWNPASVITDPSVNVFKKKLEKVWTEVFPYLHHLLSNHLFIFQPPPIPPSHHPLTVIIPFCYPIPSMRFLQARCGQLLTIIHHNHIDVLEMSNSEVQKELTPHGAYINVVDAN